MRQAFLCYIDFNIVCCYRNVESMCSTTLVLLLKLSSCTIKIMKGDDIMTILIINIMFLFVIILTFVGIINTLYTTFVVESNLNNTFYMYCIRGP